MSINLNGNRCRVIAVFLLCCLLILSASEFACAKKDDKNKKESIVIKDINASNTIKKGKRKKIKVIFRNIPGKERKVKWKSNNKSVANIDNKGFLTTKRNGRCIITCTVIIKNESKSRDDLIYKKEIKDQVLVTVCKPVKDIKTEQLAFVLKPGEKKKINATVKPADASYDSLKWTSSNPKVAAVDKKGNIKAGNIGRAVITIKTKGLSEKEKAIDVLITNRKKSLKAKYISHRGVNTIAPENTASAFRLAGMYGFYGAECDVWETKHDSRGDFDIIINHDSTFDAMTDHRGKVKRYTAEQIDKIKVTNGANAEQYNEKVCTLDTFLDICEEYGMAPIIEIKDRKLTVRGAESIVDELYGRDLLDKVCFTSLHMKPLKKILEYSKDAYEEKPDTCFMIFGQHGSNTVLKKIEKARKNNLSGVWMKSIYASKYFYKRVKKYKMICDIGPFDDTEQKSELMRFTQYALKTRFCYYDGVPGYLK